MRTQPKNINSQRWRSGGSLWLDSALAFVLTFMGTSVQAQRTNLIESSEPFTANGVISAEADSHCAALMSIPEHKRAALPAVETALKKCAREDPQKVERGTLNGVAYIFHYRDGSGSFAHSADASARAATKRTGPEYTDSWVVSCEKDPITDEKSCYMDRGDTRVWVDGRGRSELYIGSSHYPGSLVVVRIDKTAPVAINSRLYDGGFGYRASPEIIKRIVAAKSVTTRYQQWPYRDYVDETWDTYGFKEALTYIKWAVSHIK